MAIRAEDGLMLLTPFPSPQVGSQFWLSAIQWTCGNNDLEMCFDAADVRSYPGSGQYWNDISGKGVNFTLGASSGAEASDPTFNGPAGELSAYFQGDGGDYFRIDGGNTAFVNSLHKDNALFSFACWYWLSDNTSANGPMFGCSSGTTAQRGADFRWSTANDLVFNAQRGVSGSPSRSQAHGGTIPQGAWSFVAMSIDESIGANGLSITINDDLRTFSSTYTGPTASDATYPIELCASGNGNVSMASGSRMACAAFWSRKLSDVELVRLYTRTRGRFGV